ncbi:TPA: protein FsrB, partial [Enterococcus faecalis]|nr:protein FsrB [Enterococcus faecalis]HDU8558132.1 protein FsrB [Enterococcus faecalis]
IIKNVIEKRVAKVSDGVGTKPRLNQNSPNIFGQWMGQTEKPKKNIEK